jgi:hypothetical protein
MQRSAPTHTFGPATAGGSSRRKAGYAAAAAAVVAVPIGAYALWPGADTACRDRVVIVDVSDSTNETSWRAAHDVAAEATFLAAMCDTSLSVLAAVPGSTFQVVAQSDVDDIQPDGQNDRMRRRNFTDDDNAAIGSLVSDRLAEAVTGLPTDRSDIAAMLLAASDRGGPDVDVIVITDGVHIDERISLNRALVEGEGSQLGAALPITSFAANRVTFMGVGEVNSTVAAPSTLWAREVRAFVETVCVRVDANECSVNGTASAAEVLK